MANQTPGPRAAMQFWGVIQRVAREGKDAIEAQRAVSAEAARLGITTSFATRTDVGRLFSQAVELQHASRRMAAAPVEHAITAANIAPLPYARGPMALGAPRMFDVTVPYTAVRMGQEEESYVTLRYTGGLPPTIAELTAEAHDVATSLVEGYNAAVTGFGDLIIGEF